MARSLSKLRSRAVITTAALVVGIGIGAVPTAAVAAPSGLITGSVTYPAGMSFAEGETIVRLFPADDESQISSTRVRGGAYSLTGLSDGDYRILFDSWRYPVADQWWQDADHFADADIITIADGAPRSGIDVTLSTGATITGTVSGGDSQELIKRMVRAYRVGGDGDFHLENDAYIDDDGSYTLSGLRAGEYTLAFSDGWWDEWWDDQFSVATAARITLADDEVRTGIDADLDDVGGEYTWPTLDDMTPRVGQTLTVAPGAWPTGTPLTFYWDWWDEDGEYDGISNGSPTFTVPAAALGSQMAVTVEGGRSEPDGDGFVSKGTDYTAEVAPGILTSPTPTISGNAAVGRVLTADPGKWTSGTAFTYQWYADGAAIAGATKSTLTLGSAQKGARITVKVTGKKTAYTTTSKTSEQSAKVATMATPTISGKLAYKSTLTAKPGTWTSGTTFTYQWRADGVKIAGATDSTFQPLLAQTGKQISVTVTGTKPGYETLTKTSAPSAKLTLARTPTINGSPVVGKTLVASRGTWTPGMTFSYQWYASGKAIAKATKSSFTLTDSQKGKTLTVKVTGKRAGYATVAKTSAPTGRVTARASR